MDWAAFFVEHDIMVVVTPEGTVWLYNPETEQALTLLDGWPKKMTPSVQWEMLRFLWKE